MRSIICRIVAAFNEMPLLRTSMITGLLDSIGYKHFKPMNAAVNVSKNDLTISPKYFIINVKILLSTFLNFSQITLRPSTLVMESR